jgi:hypothetical protein
MMMDANICAFSDDYKIMIDTLQLKDTASDPHKSTHWYNTMDDVCPIDYVLSDISGTSYVVDSCKISDHYPAIGNIDI